METADLIRTTFAHHQWATRKLLAQLELCDQADLKEAKFTGAQSALQTLRHMIQAEAFWCATFRSVDVMEALQSFGGVETVKGLGEAWEELYRGAFDPYLATLDDEELGREVSVTFPRGDSFSPLVHVALMQVAGHSAQHRAELALMVSGLGHSPGDFDLVVFLEEAGGAPAS